MEQINLFTYCKKISNDYLNRKYKILSLYDGMSCGRIAFDKLGLQVEKYYAYEIDKYAIQVAEHNYKDIIECGDVFKDDFTKYKDFDWLIGGSPCTYWSIAQKNNRETTASGLGWELFSQYVRALKESKPKYFLYENNKSMSKEIRKSIDETFGFTAIEINSALVSAQNRKRLYWVGIRQQDGTYKKSNIDLPKDKGILLKDILDSGYNISMTEDEKSHTIKTQYFKNGIANFITNGGHIATAVAEPVIFQQNHGYNVGGIKYNKTPTLTANGSYQENNKILEPIKVGSMPRPNGELSKSQGMRIYSVDGKSVNQTAQGGGMGAKTGLYAISTTNLHYIPTIVKIRKYKCNLDSIKNELKSHKKLTCNEISIRLNISKSKVEHWFRNDKSFSIPDKETWFELKKLLNIDTKEYDDFITNFEEKYSNYESSKRYYDINCKYPTLTKNCKNNIIENKKDLYAIFTLPHGYQKGIFNYNKCPTVTTGTSNRQQNLCLEEYKNQKTSNNYEIIEKIYEVKNGYITIKEKQYPIKLQDGYYIIRKLTVNECKRLQTVSENYDMTCISNSQAYKCLGNGWTVDVICHLIKSTLQGE